MAFVLSNGVWRNAVLSSGCWLCCWCVSRYVLRWEWCGHVEWCVCTCARRSRKKRVSPSVCVYTLVILTLYACGVRLLLVFVMCVCTFVILTLYVCGVDGVDGVGGVVGVDGIGGVDGLDKWVCCERHCASYSGDAPSPCSVYSPLLLYDVRIVLRAYTQNNSWVIRVVGGY